MSTIMLPPAVLKSAVASSRSYPLMFSLRLPCRDAVTKIRGTESQLPARYVAAASYLSAPHVGAESWLSAPMWVQDLSFQPPMWVQNLSFQPDMQVLNLDFQPPHVGSGPTR